MGINLGVNGHQTQIAAEQAVTFQNWMTVALVIVLIGAPIAWWRQQ
jgi:hypothetical protein